MPRKPHPAKTKDMSATSLVRAINAILAAQHKAVGKAPKKIGNGVKYILFDCTKGERQPLTLKELKALARLLGVLE
jgi:hypothetical protein